MQTAGQIASLAEPGLSRAHGAIADGHHDREHFAALVSLEYAREIDATDVQIGYRRILRGVSHLTSRAGKGATPVTWVHW